MKSKLITTVAIGAALLGTGTLAMAHDRDDDWRRDQWREHRSPEHQWREHRWHEREWREHRPHWHPEYYRYEPRWERRYDPAPDWRYRSAYPREYDRDGVSIILRGRFN
jgi:hypothetical protein